jgi:hypothetical protein
MRKKWYKVQGPDHLETMYGTAKAVQAHVRSLHKTGIPVEMLVIKNRAEQRACAEIVR